MKRVLPEWVLKHKTKGVDIRFINNFYYAYKRHSVWDSEKKRAKTVTDEYVGKITQEGIIKSKHQKIIQEISQSSIKEYGASKLIFEINKELIENLKDVFPNLWQFIFSLAVERFFYSSPLKNMQTHFNYSSLSDEFPQVNLSSKNASELLRNIGSDRNSVVDFLKKLMIGTEHLIIDLTAIYSQAENPTYPTFGHNSQNEYLPQINMLLLFSKDKNRPIYFRLLPGSIVDITSIKLTLEESQANNAVFIGDKAFYSESNIISIKSFVSKYILPLRRNLAMIDYSPTKSNTKKSFDGYFFFKKKVIWYKEKKQNDDRVILFLNESLKICEQQGFLERINAKTSELTIEEYHEKENTFGTISIITNTDYTPEDIYSYLKSRLHIESAFDTFKNTLEADRTYMRTDQHLQGWCFINFISLYLYYSIYGILLSNKLLKNFSPKDIILHFSKVHKIKLKNKEIITEIPKTVRTLIEKMKLDEKILTNQNKNQPHNICPKLKS